MENQNNRFDNVSRKQELGKEIESLNRQIEELTKQVEEKKKLLSLEPKGFFMFRNGSSNTFMTPRVNAIN